MGYYINKTTKGKTLPSIGKATALINDGGKAVSGDKFEENLVCVVSNGLFDAAGYCYSEEEYEIFKEPDGRTRTWLVHPEAKQLSDFDS